jgi:hypothetical protein
MLSTSASLPDAIYFERKTITFLEIFRSLPSTARQNDTIAQTKEARIAAVCTYRNQPHIKQRSLDLVKLASTYFFHYELHFK